MPSIKPMTEAQAKVLNAVCRYRKASGGHFPTIAWLTKQLGYASPYAAWRHVQNLKARGHLVETGPEGRLVPTEEGK